MRLRELAAIAAWNCNCHVAFAEFGTPQGEVMQLDGDSVAHIETVWVHDEEQTRTLSVQEQEAVDRAAHDADERALEAYEHSTQEQEAVDRAAHEADERALEAHEHSIQAQQAADIAARVHEEQQAADRAAHLHVHEADAQADEISPQIEAALHQAYEAQKRAVLALHPAEQPTPITILVPCRNREMDVLQLIEKLLNESMPEVRAGGRPLVCERPIPSSCVCACHLLL